MKAITLQKRLNKLTYSKNNIVYTILKAIAYNTPNLYVTAIDFIRPCRVTGSGSYIKNVDHTKDITEGLKLLRLKIEEGNDAPRGGKPGNYIKILTKIIHA